MFYVILPAFANEENRGVYIAADTAEEAVKAINKEVAARTLPFQNQATILDASNPDVVMDFDTLSALADEGY